jgi:hypothetical protein
MSTLNVVEQVLRERREAMVVKEIVAAAGERLPTKSRTPDTVVARDLSMDLKRRGEESIFIRVSPGRYSLKELVSAGVVRLPDSVSAEAPAATPVAGAAFVPPATAPELRSDTAPQ